MSTGRGWERELYPNGGGPVPPDTILQIIQAGKGWIDVVSQEGKVRRAGGSLSWRYHNPGNIKFGKFAQAHGSIGPGWGNHAVFPDYETGLYAQQTLLFSNQSRYVSMTIRDAIATYAPISDTGLGVPQGGNQPLKYASWLAKNLNVDINTRLVDLHPELQQRMVKLMNVYEGHKIGSINFI